MKSQQTGRSLGTVRIERDGPGFCYMLPDGTVGAGLRADVERAVRAWARKHTGKHEITEVQLEWPATL